MKVRYQLIILLLICLCTFFVHLNQFYPDLMEYRNFITVREMIEHGNWWFTTLNLEPRLEKPPLPTWITAISTMYLGGLDNLVAMRLPGTISATLMVFFFFGFCKELTKEKYFALLASAIMATGFMVIQMGRTNSWDIYTHSFMVGSLWQYLVGVNRRSWRNIFWATLLMGASVLSKGPVSLYALWLPFVIAMGIAKGTDYLKGNWKELTLILLGGLLIGFSWNIYMYFFQPEATEFVLDKETTSWANRHVKPFFFYLHFPVYIGIWCMPVVASFFYKYAAPRVNKYGNYKFTLFWMLFSIFLLSVIPTKKERYLLPAMIPMSLTAAYLIYALIQKFRLNNEGKWDKVFFSIFSLIIGVGLILLPFAILIFYSASYTALSIVTAFIIACIGVAILWYWKSKKADRVVGLSILAVCVFCLGLIPKAADWFYHYDEFKPLTEIRSFEELEEVDFYTELDEIDPRLVWMIGKHSRPVSSISLKEESNYPLVMVSLSPLEHFISRPNILDSLKITDYGIYDMNRKNSKWKARVHLLELKSE